jgi:O-antigen ligase
LTLTRSYLVILFGLILALPFLLRTSRGGWLFLLLAGGIGAALVVDRIDPEFLSLALRLEGDITSLRGDIWKFTVENLDVRAWLIGMGFGSAVWSDFFSPLSLDKELQSPHSALLEVIGQFGVAGLVAYLAIWWTLLHSFVRTRHDPWRAAIPLTALLILVRELVAMSYVFSPSVLSAYFWTIFGMALATSRHYDRRSNDERIDSTTDLPAIHAPN